ncbi:hypothetical protein [uncultured Dubosiella sp.]|uniref:hypothetical protein n=1 Tax=uncultured Dubosiella sp. TaxID=1937011 RepID=UPI00272F16EF|nr:hypothetical protein [uncultured Dubosiella sp.]
MEIKLTPEMFEAATWGPNNVGQTWDEMKQNSGSRICSIAPIPFEGQVYISIQPGYRFCIAQFDENQKNLGSHTYYDWRTTPQMCVLDSRTRYIGLCFGDTGDVNKISQILGGGALIMSDYPTLQIVTNSDGLEYAKGYNLLSVSKSTLVEIGRSGACAVSKVVSESGFDLVFTKDTTGIAAVRFQRLELPYALTPYRITYEAWAELPSGSPKIRCNNDVCDANQNGVEITATRTKFISTHMPAKTYIFDNTYHGFTDFEISGVGAAIKANTTIHVRNIILTLSQDEFAFRPNPADLTGGGTYGSCS